MKDLSEEKLMTMVRNGNLDSLGPLYEKYKSPLYNFFYRMTFDEDISKDLTQSVFYRIIKYRNSFQKEHKFKSWIYQLARNIRIDYYKKNKIRIDEYKKPEELNDSQAGNYEEIEKKERYEQLYEALSKLNPDQREILEMSRFQGMRYEEIALITGNSAGSLKVKAHRAMNKLREIYFDKEIN
ncbi:RNA polymerase sigma factor [Bacteroidota bacterium]